MLSPAVAMVVTVLGVHLLAGGRAPDGPRSGTFS
jgi:hypothetical protein